jgi:hypothetical protein
MTFTGGEKRHQQPARAADDQSASGRAGRRPDIVARHPRRAGETSGLFPAKLDNVEIATILKAFNYSLNLTGKLSLTGFLRRKN